MNKHIFFRSLFFLIPRVLVITTFLYALTWVEWSPFPEWSYIPVAYVLHFVITYVFSRWTFGRHIPSYIDAVVVSAVNIVIGTGLEIAIAVWRTGADFSQAATSYNWHSLAILVVYVVGTFLAAWRVRSKQQKEISQLRPDETRSSEGAPPSSGQLPPVQA